MKKSILTVPNIMGKVASLAVVALLTGPTLSHANNAAESEQYRIQELSGISEGTYTSKDKSQTQIVIKKEVSRFGVNFYAILSVGSNKTGLFKVEPINQSTLALTQINMGSQNILKTNNESQPSYSAQIVNMNKDVVLVLTATSLGMSNGCPQSLRLSLGAAGESAWVGMADMAVQSLKINTDAKVDLVMTKNGPMKEYSLNILGGDDLGKSWSGQYLVREQINGLGLMRKVELDSMKASGFSLSRHSVSAIVPMLSKNKSSIKLVHLQAGSTSCLSTSSNIK